MTVSFDEFAQRAMSFLRSQGETRKLVADEKRQYLIVGESPQVVSFAYLKFAYGEYSAALPSEYDKVLHRRLWTVISPQARPSREVLFRSVLPRLRDRAWFSAVRRQAELELGADEAAIEEVMLPHRAVNSELSIHLAFELPTSLMELGTDRLRAWGVTFDEMLEIAKRNLRARSTTPFDSPEPGMFISPFKDSYDATRMILPELFEALQVKGRPVLIAATHDIVLVTGDEDGPGLEKLGAWAEQALLEPRPNSAVTFRLEGKGWRPWLPNRDHPAYAKLKLLQLQTVASAYSRQKEVLEALLEGNGHDIFVANLRAFRSTTGAIFTSCSWTEGVEALLPETDRLDFVRLPPDGDAANGTVWSTTWVIAVRTLGTQMVPTGDVPERWRVRGFPTDAQLAQMAAEGHVPA